LPTMSAASDRPLGSRGTTIDDMDGYDKTFGKEDKHKRGEDAQAVTVKFYNLITDFYINGWGMSFHFAPRYKGEMFAASVARHEHYLARKIDLQPGDKVLDVGCGVMGPAREIARFSSAHITGLNLNEYQLEKAVKFNRSTTIPHLLSAKKGDFMNIPFDDNTFDKIYAIEALCHAPDRQKVYEQVYKKVKPGGLVGLYEWGMTDKYDPKNSTHVKIKKMIEYGNSICEMGSVDGIREEMESVGFIVHETTDLARESKNMGNEVPWYATLQGGYSIQNVRHSWFGRLCTQTMVTVLEKMFLAPEGTTRAHNILIEAADSLVEGGMLDIFTPMYLVVAEKPKKSNR